MEKDTEANVTVDIGNMEAKRRDDTEGKTVEILIVKYARLMKTSRGKCTTEVEQERNERVAEQEAIECAKELKGLNEIDDIEGIVEIFDNGTGLDDLDENDSDSEEDESYVAESGSSDTEESLENDYEVSAGSDESACDEGELGQNEVDVPNEQRYGRNNLNGNQNGPCFILGQLFLTKKDLRIAIDKHAIHNGVNLKRQRSSEFGTPEAYTRTRRRQIDSRTKMKKEKVLKAW
ncbi:hypothetical protein K1719_040146 [Acacia pycnantha]|nr:hypothetical protein K1719_040146 [Acacia pycnantha]